MNFWLFCSQESVKSRALPSAVKSRNTWAKSSMRISPKALGESLSSTPPALQEMANSQGASGAESLAKHKPAQHRKSKKEFSLIPTLLGITLACVVVTVFACYHIFSSSSNVLFSNREDVVLADFVGMTRAQVEADPSYKDLKVVFDEEYDSNAEAGYVYSQMPKAGRCRENC